MKKVLSEQVIALLNSCPQWIIATFDEDANAIPVAFKTILPDGTLAVADVFMETTVANVKKNGRIAISAHKPATAHTADMEGYQIKGSAVYCAEGAVFDAVSKVVSDNSNGLLKARGILLITPERVIVTAPGPYNKKEL